MCGIAGLFQTATDGQSAEVDSGSPISAQDAVTRMVRQLLHRGPDGHGIEVAQPNVVLGHTRLAILDLSAAGRQPMASDDGALWTVFNGEIYNVGDLRRELECAETPWRSRSDTEVLPRAYARWGRRCVEHLRGMFAFAIWDGRRQELFLARDRFGIKPLYYYAGAGVFAFASEVRALLQGGPARRLDPVALWYYLAYQAVPAPRTLVEGVRMLPPGSWLVVRADGSLVEQRYWDSLDNAAPEAAAASEAASRRRVGELLQESVALHLVSDVPVSAFLSGGIDSSVVVALMRESGATPRTFTVGFAERAYDETVYARQVAARFQTEHSEIRLKETDVLDQVPEALDAQDQPSGDGLNTYVVARAVRAAGLKVALSGLGGDELFGGYPSFARLARYGRILRLWGRAPGSIRQLAGGAVRTLGRSSIAASKSAALLAGDGTLPALYPPLREVLSTEQRRALLEKGWSEAGLRTADPYRQLLEEELGRAKHTGLSAISYAEARTYLHDVLLRDADQMSMAHGLEVRVPLLDHRLAEYVIGVPDAAKRPNGGTPKRLLVESLGELLPAAIVRRPKQGFSLPMTSWMRGPLRGLCEAKLGPRGLVGRGIVRPEAVAALWQDFLTGKPTVSWSRLWLLVALEAWLEHQGF